MNSTKDTTKESTIGKPREYTDEDLLNALRKAAEELGRTPKVNDMKAAKGRVSFGTIQQRFGTFNNGLELAGLEPNRKSPKPVPVDWVVQSKEGFDTYEDAEEYRKSLPDPDKYEVNKVFKDRSLWGRNK